MPRWLQKLVQLIAGPIYVPQRVIDRENELTEILELLRDSAIRNEDARRRLKVIIDKRDKDQNA